MRSKEHNDALRLSQPNRKEIIVGTEKFMSINECARYFGISRTAVLYRLRNWDDWKYAN